MPLQPGKLYIVATPIGNLQDISLRLQTTLQEVNIIAAEDTRRTRQLCNHLNIEKPNLIRCDETKEEHTAPALIKNLELGQSIALVSDAGTPCIADPGWKVVELARKHNIPVFPICGPSAITSALSIAGFPATPFTFYGFLDKKKSRSQNTLQTMFTSPHTSIFFEFPYRIEKTITQMQDIEPSRVICMIREISKKYEQSHYGTVEQIGQQLTTTKGEWSIVISPNHDRFRA
ncbi:MAG: 16S rRNA (cytidine(1402)-2'-O)-methyltransferase [Deltaproteobacteria bacterium]|nr:16S rRNA (cytidine(1402)-2'-O)-methyltransferase [Deltaproteobacteria bacterium]